MEADGNAVGSINSTLFRSCRLDLSWKSHIYFLSRRRQEEQHEKDERLRYEAVGKEIRDSEEATESQHPKKTRNEQEDIALLILSEEKTSYISFTLKNNK